MAGVHSRRPGGKCVKIALPNGAPVLCFIRHGDTAGLKHCVKCEYIPEEVYVYERCTTYCGCCFHQLKDGGSKTKNRPQMQKELDVKFTLNLGLQKITLDCPICPEAAQYKDIKKHIAEMHPDYFGQEAQPSPQKNQVPQTRSSTLEEVSARTAGKGRFGQAASPCSFRKQSEAIERKGETELQRPKEQLGHGGKPLFFPSPQSCGHGSSADIDIEMVNAQKYLLWVNSNCHIMKPQAHIHSKSSKCKAHLLNICTLLKKNPKEYSPAE